MRAFSSQVEYEPLMGSNTNESSAFRRYKTIGFGTVLTIAALFLYVNPFSSSQPQVQNLHLSNDPVVDQSTNLAAQVDLDVVYATTPTEYVSSDFSGDLRARCKVAFFEQTLDHFQATEQTYLQRYFICQEFWDKQSGPIFFYVGNEANVELYLNHTGLMWENAKEFNALLVFAEHRYFGESMPFNSTTEARKHIQHLSSEQALADYAVLIRYIKEQYQATKSAVIGFGGSYGGMLATWFRIKYPHIIDGVVAGSAPVLSFLGEDPPMDPASFSKIVTFDASPAAGSAEKCIPNIKRVWDVVFNSSQTQAGRDMLAESFQLCEPLTTADDASSKLPDWMKGAFDYMAMGNYPYPSSYIMNGASVLPAYPVQVACSHLSEDFDTDASLVQAAKNSINVYYNSTNDKKCHSFQQPSNESQIDADFWDYLFCSELYQPTDQGTGKDMFWTVVHNQTADNERCMKLWGVSIRPYWATIVYGGRKALRASSNIVFSNGDFDPWSGTGVLESLSDSVVAVPVKGGAHHLDFMFSNPLDSEGVLTARKEEKKHMWKWVKEVASRHLY